MADTENALTEDQQRQINRLVAKALLMALIPLAVVLYAAGFFAGDKGGATGMASPRLLGILTDFGGGSYSLGSFKAQIYGTTPGAQIIDISHEIPNFDVSAGSWVLFNAARSFPAGSVLVAVVNPGADLHHSMLVVTQTPRLYFLGAGPGLFDHVAQSFGVAQAFPVDIAGENTSSLEEFVPLARTLLNQGTVEDLQRKQLIGTTPLAYTPVLASTTQPPKIEANQASGYICAIDNWGNLQTNLPAAVLAGGGNYTVTIGNHTVTGLVSGKSYTAGEGKPGVLVTQDGYVQVAIYKGSAKDAFAVRAAETPVVITRQGP